MFVNEYKNLETKNIMNSVKIYMIHLTKYQNSIVRLFYLFTPCCGFLGYKMYLFTKHFEGLIHECKLNNKSSVCFNDQV